MRSLDVQRHVTSQGCGEHNLPSQGYPDHASGFVPDQTLELGQSGLHCLPLLLVCSECKQDVVDSRKQLWSMDAHSGQTTLNAQRVAHLLGGERLKGEGRKICLFAQWEILHVAANPIARKLPECPEELDGTNDPAHMLPEPLLDPTLAIHLGSRNACFDNDTLVGSHDITLEQGGAIEGREEREIAVGRREVVPKALLQYLKVLEEGVESGRRMTDSQARAK